MPTDIIFKPKAFYRRIEVKTKIGGDLVESLQWSNMRFEIVFKWEWYFRYRTALLQIKYPRYKVDLVMYSKDPVGLTKTQIDEALKKKRIVTCKRMITKIGNKISQYEEEENKTLLPNWENPYYINEKTKLNNYKEELDSLLNKK